MNRCNSYDPLLDSLCSIQSSVGTQLDDVHRQALKFILSKIQLKDALSMSLAPIQRGFGLNFIGVSPANLFMAVFDRKVEHFQEIGNEKVKYGYTSIFKALKKKDKPDVRDPLEFVFKVLCNFQSRRLWSTGRHIQELATYVTRTTRELPLKPQQPQRQKRGEIQPQPKADLYLSAENLWLQTNGSSMHFVFKSTRKESAPPKYRQNGVLVSGDVFLNEIETDLQVLATADDILKSNMADPSNWQGPEVTKSAFRNTLRLAELEEKKKAFESAENQIVFTSDGGIRYIFGLCAQKRSTPTNPPTPTTSPATATSPTPKTTTVQIAALREILYTGPTMKVFNNLVQDLKMTANTESTRNDLKTIDEMLQSIASHKPTDQNGLAMFVESYAAVFDRLSKFYRDPAYKAAQFKVIQVDLTIS